MRLPFTILLASILICFNARAEQPRYPIQIITPSGWILEISPEGAGKLYRAKPPYASASTEANCFDYDNLYLELASNPKGDSDILYGFNGAGTVFPIPAPKQSKMIPAMLKYVDEMLSPEKASAFLKARETYPLLTDLTRKTEQGAAANP